MSIVGFYWIFEYFATNEGIYDKNPDAQIQFFVGHRNVISACANFFYNIVYNQKETLIRRIVFTDSKIFRADTIKDRKTFIRALFVESCIDAIYP
jgi:hypothetical protein